MKTYFLTLCTLVLIGCAEEPSNSETDLHSTSVEVSNDEAGEGLTYSDYDKEAFDSILKFRGYRFYKNTIYEYDTLLSECTTRAFIHKRLGEFEDVGHFHPHIHANPCYVYSSPQEGAAIIDTLATNQSCNILDQVDDFYLICAPDGNSAYVRRTDIGLYLIGYNRIITTQYSSNTMERSGSCMETEVTIENGRTEPKHSITLELPTDFYQVEEMDSWALAGKGTVIRISDHCYSGIGTTIDYYVFEANDGHLEILETRGEGDGGASDQSEAFFPQQHVNGGPIVYALRGELLLSDIKGKLIDMLEYPEGMNIPKNQLIIIRNSSTDYDLDLGLREFHTQEYTYYQWDGNTLRKIEA